MEKIICNLIGVLLILAIMLSLVLCFCLQSTGSYISLAISLLIGYLYFDKAPEFI